MENLAHPYLYIESTDYDMYLFFYDVIGVCLIIICYEFYLFIFFYIDRSLMRYIVLAYFSKLLKLRFLPHYTLITYFTTLLRLRFVSTTF